ncbi:hypothetical protein HK105_205443 [Polyrhizophydium stewartii]|uniref:Uncharacterized protein n=1 Tax=Polyrhizophydium stewartii TaxID=2732419 RepID=A0ABR4N6M2_9FUNG
MNAAAVPLPETEADWLAALAAVATAVEGVAFITALPHDGVGDLLVGGLARPEPAVVDAALALATRLLGSSGSGFADKLRVADVLQAVVTLLGSPDTDRRIKAAQIISSVSNDFKYSNEARQVIQSVVDHAEFETNPRCAELLLMASVAIKVEKLVRLIIAKFDAVSSEVQEKTIRFISSKIKTIPQTEDDLVRQAAQLLIYTSEIELFVSVGYIEAIDQSDLIRSSLHSSMFRINWSFTLGQLLFEIAHVEPSFFKSQTVATLVDGLASTDPNMVELCAESVLRPLKDVWGIPYDFDRSKIVGLLDLGLVRNIFAMISQGLFPKVDLPVAAIRTLLEIAQELGQPNRVVVDVDQCDGVATLRRILDDGVNAQLKNTVTGMLRTFFPHHTTTADTSIIPCPDNDAISFKVGYSSMLEAKPRTLVEKLFVALMTAILSKPSWWTKIGDAAIADRWRAEAAAQGVSAAAINLALEETAFLATHGVRSVLGGTMTVVHGAVERTVVSDDAVAGDLRAALVVLAGALEDVPEHKKDWHPGTRNQVLDLVHPSLFCLVYGRTLVADIGERRGATEMLPWDVLGNSEKVADVPVFDSQPQFSSRRFQWLPAEFRVQDDGSVSILSPINNLHPMRHRGLYATVAKVFSRFVPLFEELAGIMRAEFGRSYIKNPIEGYEQPDRYDDQGNKITDAPRPVHVPKLPEHFEPPEKLPEPVGLRGRNLQVSVKLANIHLTPENPRYDGGSWHIEGTINESIVATGICYYDMDNITTSRLSFRTALSEDIDYEQDDRMYWMDVYGIANEETQRVEELGALEAKLGRCIVFPNVHQHRVEPFELADPTRPGFRKILVFFLVDPTKRIVSTAHMAPQQQDWHEAGLRATPLPPELWPLVTPHIPGTMTLDNSKEVRLELMDERTDVQSVVNNQVFGQRFTLCEH